MEKERTASALATLPLGLVAVSFFLPFLRTCNQMQSPIDYIDSIPSALWVAPPFVAAALLALVGALALARRRAPGRGAFTVAHVALAGCVVACAMHAAALCKDHGPHDFGSLTIMAWPVAPVAAALPFFLFSRRCRGWARWIRLLGAHAALASLHAVWTVGEVFSGTAGKNVGIGGWLYLASDALLLVLALAGSRRREIASI